MKLSSPIAVRHSRIEIIPLIDIMFFLLAAFMMVSLRLDRTQNIRVDLPAATQAKAGFEPDMLHLAVDKAGAVWIARKEVTLAELTTVLTNRFRANSETPVYISGDRTTRHAHMAAVLQTVRSAGLQKVAFLVDGAPTEAAP